MSPCLDDLVRDPARAGLTSSQERQALLAHVVALLFALGAPAGGDGSTEGASTPSDLKAAPLSTFYRHSCAQTGPSGATQSRVTLRILYW